MTNHYCEGRQWSANWWHAATRTLVSTATALVLLLVAGAFSHLDAQEAEEATPAPPQKTPACDVTDPTDPAQAASASPDMRQRN